MNHEQPNHENEETRALPPQEPATTHRYHGPPPWEAAPAQAAPDRGRVLGVAVLVGALVVGLLGGIIGAAGFTVATGLLGGGGSSRPGAVATSQVSDREDTPAVEGSAQEVAARVLPSVVMIGVSGASGSGAGSGVIISSDGEILTNNHVVEGAEGGSLTVSFHDGTTARARVLGTDPVTDIAVIQAEGVDGLTPATIGQSSLLDVGEAVVAIGSPFGLEATVTSGIVSALDRPVSAGSQRDATATIYPAIQTDAAINPGNSGGPLVNMAGEVVGVNSSIRTTVGAFGEAGSIGLGFAIPIDKVLPIVEQLRDGETPTHAQLGISVSDARSEDGLVGGAGVEQVNEGSAADEAGIRPGDVVVKVDDTLITGSESLVATIRGYRPGDTVSITLIRDSEEVNVEATLDSDVAGPGG